jgi:DNA-binding NtrC family response regulator
MRAMDWSRPPRVIVLDDERVIADTLAQILRLNGCDASAVYSAASALQALDEEPPDLLITDVALDPDSINGIDVAIYYERECPECKILLISGHAATTDLLSNAQKTGRDFRLLQKPVHPDELLSGVSETLAELRQKVA